MRVSTYEIILPLIGKDDKIIEGKALLVNGLYGALDVVDEATASKLREERFAEIPFALRERLTQRGHITRKDEAGELADAQLLGRVWRKLIGHSGRGPVILPTYNCNFRCPYCFERHRLTRGQEWLGHEMNPEMVDAVFAALQKQREQGHKVNSCYIDLLEEFGFSHLQVTIDGVGELNDRRRLHRDGVPTYDRILKNVALALEHGVDISLRVNVNGDNIGGIKALIDDLTARGLHEARREERMQADKEAREAEKAGKPRPKRKGFFSYYFKAVSEDHNSPTKVTEQQVMDAIIAAGIPPMDAIEKQSQYSMPMQGLYAAMKKEDFPSFSPAFCGSEQGMLVIGPDGLIYPCWDLVAMEEDAVGFTDEATGRFFFNFGKAKWRTRTSDLMKPCQTCPYIFICRGGCAPEAKRVHGSYFRENCGEAKEIFAFVAPRVVGAKWEETGEDELSISLAGPLARLTEAERETLMTATHEKEMFAIINEAGLLPDVASEEMQKA